MKVVLSPTARRKLDTQLEYLQEEWSVKVKREFIKKLDKSIDQIATHPKSCPESHEFKGLHKCVVTKQTSLFYRIKKEEIEVITLFDNRQDPSKLKG